MPHLQQEAEGLQGGAVPLLRVQDDPRDRQRRSGVPRLSPLSVNLVTTDPLLVERAKAFGRRASLLKISVSSRALTGGGFAACVLPAAGLPPASELAALQAAGSAVYAYGPPAGLRAAFLAGCDDYLKEPWNLEELECRLERLAVDRARLQGEGLTVSLPWGWLTVRSTSATSARGTVPLSLSESRILCALLRALGQAVPREVLAYAAWGRPAARGSRALDVHISSLRRKLAELGASADRPIRTLRGVGYLLA